jgi:hypothetical protein
MVPYAGISFACFDRIKRFILKKKVKYLTSESTNTNNRTTSTTLNNSTTTTNKKEYYELTVLGRLLSGAFTGIFTQTITYPIDVVRRHMQLLVMLNDSAIKQ